MKALLDTHTLIWEFDEPKKLSSLAAATILDPANERFVSIATAWEIAIKVSIKKLTLSMPFRPWIEKALLDLKVAIRSATLDHIEVVASLPHHHSDPFDRLIIAQCVVDGVPVISADPAFDAYSIQRIR